MKILKYIIFLAFIGITSFYLSTKINLNSNVFSTIATFLSITIGFTITALSIIATSKFSKKLYEVESDEDNSKTLLHVLVHAFKKSTVFFIITIALIIFLGLFPDNEEILFSFLDIGFDFIKILEIVILLFTVISVLSFIDLLFTFSKFVIKSGSLLIYR